MFRDEETQAEYFKGKFEILKEKFDALSQVQMDSEYHKLLKSYIERLYAQTCENATFDDQRLGEIREAEMSHLNRLQKLKNATSYKKDKHKTKQIDQDWG